MTHNNDELLDKLEKIQEEIFCVEILRLNGYNRLSDDEKTVIDRIRDKYNNLMCKDCNGHNCTLEKGCYRLFRYDKENDYARIKSMVAGSMFALATHKKPCKLNF